MKKSKYYTYDGTPIEERYFVEGEYGGYFKTLKEAKQSAKLQSKEHKEFTPIYNTIDYTWKIAYRRGRLENEY